MIANCKFLSQSGTSQTDCLLANGLSSSRHEPGVGKPIQSLSDSSL